MERQRDKVGCFLPRLEDALTSLVGNWGSESTESLRCLGHMFMTTEPHKRKQRRGERCAAEGGRAPQVQTWFPVLRSSTVCAL